MSSWTAIVTCLALVLYLVHAIRVTLARGRYSIMAPATTGHPTFERLLRPSFGEVDPCPYRQRFLVELREDRVVDESADENAQTDRQCDRPAVVEPSCRRAEG
jgi:hypothetical protein